MMNHVRVNGTKMELISVDNKNNKAVVKFTTASTTTLVKLNKEFISKIINKAPSIGFTCGVADRKDKTIETKSICKSTYTYRKNEKEPMMRTTYKGTADVEYSLHRSFECFEIVLPYSRTGEDGLEYKGNAICESVLIKTDVEKRKFRMFLENILDCMF